MPTTGKKLFKVQVRRVDTFMVAVGEAPEGTTQDEVAKKMALDAEHNRDSVFNVKTDIRAIKCEPAKG